MSFTAFRKKTSNISGNNRQNIKCLLYNEQQFVASWHQNSTINRKSLLCGAAMFPCRWKLILHFRVLLWGYDRSGYESGIRRLLVQIQSVLHQTLGGRGEAPTSSSLFAQVWTLNPTSAPPAAFPAPHVGCFFMFYVLFYDSTSGT